MSSSRNAKSFQIVESKWWLCISRVLTGSSRTSAIMGTSCWQSFVYIRLPDFSRVAVSARLMNRSALLQNGGMLDWGDLRIFLAVAERRLDLAGGARAGVEPDHGQPAGAGARARLGLTLFARRSTGYAPTDHGRALRDAADRRGRRRWRSRSEAERLRRLVSGLIRVTAPESVFAHLLAPIVVAYRKEHPEVQIEQVSSELPLDIEGGEVDIAFRATEGAIGDRLIVPAAAGSRLDPLLQPRLRRRARHAELPGGDPGARGSGLREGARAGSPQPLADGARRSGAHRRAQQRGAEHARAAARLARRRAAALHRGRHGGAGSLLSRRGRISPGGGGC